MKQIIRMLTVTTLLWPAHTNVVAVSTGAGTPGAVSTGAGTPGDDQPTVASVLAFERARFEATRTSNVAKLRAMLADDLTWVHSSGKKQNKTQYIRDLETSRTYYKAITVEEQSARLFGTIAVTTGRARYDAVSAGKPMVVQAYHTAVYRFQNGRWQVVAWQATRVAPNEP